MNILTTAASMSSEEAGERARRDDPEDQSQRKRGEPRDVRNSLSPTSAVGEMQQRQSSAAVNFPAVGSADVAIYWDFQNVRIPAWCPATAAAEAIREKVNKYGRIVEKRLYYDSRQPGLSVAPRSDLDLGGFTLVDCPSRGRKETLDKKLIVDVLCFAWERASLGAKACVVLITSDGDYSYTLARLRDIGVFTVVIYRPDVVANVLIDNSNVAMSWEFDLLGGPPASQSDEEEYDEDSRGSDKLELSATDSVDGETSLASDTLSTAAESDIKQPDLHTRGKFALFCSVVLNAQHRNVRPGLNVYSSWADASRSAMLFYQKLGEKDRQAYEDIRTLASEKGFIEWGRRDLTVAGKPIIKVKEISSASSSVKADGLSLELFLRLTPSGVSVVKPEMASTESGRNVSPFKPREAGSRVPSAYPSTARSADAKARSGKLFVGGIAWRTTEDSLRTYFRKYGPLEYVFVHGGGKFGYVFFRYPNDAEAVLKGRHTVDGKPVDVKPYVYDRK